MQNNRKNTLTMYSITKWGALVVALAFTLVGTPALAATSLNSHPSDFPTALVMNVTKNGVTSTQWAPTVLADPGDEVAVQIYYHNTGQEIARNVRASLRTQPVGPAVSYGFQALVTADNAASSGGSAEMQITGGVPQTLTYIQGSAIWRPNTGGATQDPTTFRPFPNGDGNNITVGAVSIGDIEPDLVAGRIPFSEQGVVIAHFRVGAAALPPPPPPSVTPPDVETISGQSLGRTACLLTGDLRSTGGALSVEAFFEFSTNSSLSNPQQTAIQTRATLGTFTDTISGLTDDTVYFFRAVARNQAGTDRGAVLACRTDVAPAAQAATQQPAQVTQTNNQTVTQTVTIERERERERTLQYLPAYIPPTPIAAPVYVPPTPIAQTTLTSFCVPTVAPRAQTILANRIPGRDAVLMQGHTTALQGGGNLTGWFEWGPTPALGSRTPQQIIVARNQGNSSLYQPRVNLPLINDQYARGTFNQLYTSVAAPQYTQTVGTATFDAQVNFLNPGRVYFFRAVVENCGHTTYGETLSFRMEGQDLFFVPEVVNFSTLTAITHPASSITPQNATLNGIASDDGRVGLSSWFEWGTTPNLLGNRTARVDHGMVASVTSRAPISGLSLGTTYFFRIVAQARDGSVAHGEILSFRTAGQIVIPPITTVTLTATKPQLVVEKSVRNDSRPVPQSAGNYGEKGYGANAMSANALPAMEGDLLTYSITVRNVGDGNAIGVVASDILSDFYTFEGATDNGQLSIVNNRDRKIKWSLGTILPNAARTVSFTVRVLHCEVPNDIVNTALVEGTGTGKVSSNASRVSIGRSVAVAEGNGYSAGLLSMGPLVFLIEPERVSAMPGQDVVLTMRYQNQSGAPIENLTLRSMLPTGTEFVAALDERTMTNFNRTTMFEIGRVMPGESGAVRLTLRVSRDESPGRVLELVGVAGYDYNGSGTRASREASSYITVLGANENMGSPRTNTAATSFLGEGFLPGSLLGWLGLILLVIVIAVVVRKSI